jgi:outer membrane lipoprotein-sorting protein
MGGISPHDTRSVPGLTGGRRISPTGERRAGIGDSPAPSGERRPSPYRIGIYFGYVVQELKTAMKTLTSSSIVTLALAALAPFTAAAQEAALPSVDQVLDKYIAATGGKDAIQKVTSRVAKGTMDIVTFGASGSLEQYTKAPNQSVTIIEVAGYGTVIQCYDGKTGWASDPQQGFRELSGAELDVFKRSADLQAALHTKNHYKTLTVTGKGKVGDKDVYVLEGQRDQGGAEKLYFDAQTGLLTKLEMPSPQGSGTISMLFEDFKDVDGVKIPATIRQETPEISLVIKMEDIKQNVPIDASKFAKPAEPTPTPTPAPAMR